jgi:hypothetical protein
MKVVISRGFIFGFKLLYVRQRLETRIEGYGSVAASD